MRIHPSSSSFGVLLGVLLYAPASAATSEICYSPAVIAATHAPPTNATLFECPVLGIKTLPQLAGLGWEVVGIAPLSVGGSTIADQLVLQRGALIHANGFEP
jgi:hypothetical protein